MATDSILTAEQKAAIKARKDEQKRNLDNIKAANAALNAEEMDMLRQQREAQASREKSFADYALGLQQDRMNAERENEILSKGESDASKWAGLTQLASGVANLIGASNGATPQVHVNYVDDWKNKADANMRARRARIDSIKDRQRAAEMQLSAVREGNAMEDMRTRGRIASEKYRRQAQESAQEYKDRVGIIDATDKYMSDNAKRAAADRAYGLQAAAAANARAEQARRATGTFVLNNGDGNNVDVKASYATVGAQLPESVRPAYERAVKSQNWGEAIRIAQDAAAADAATNKRLLALGDTAAPAGSGTGANVPQVTSDDNPYSVYR